MDVTTSIEGCGLDLIPDPAGSPKRRTQCYARVQRPPLLSSCSHLWRMPKRKTCFSSHRRIRASARLLLPILTTTESLIWSLRTEPYCSVMATVRSDKEPCGV